MREREIIAPCSCSTIDESYRVMFVGLKVKQTVRMLWVDTLAFGMVVDTFCECPLKKI